MSRQKRDRDEVKKVKDSVVLEHKKESDALPPIVRDTGGSIAALNGNKSLYFKKWVHDLQERKNPLIGKDYIMAATEYNTESKLIGEAKIEELSDEMRVTLDNGAKEYKNNTVDYNKDDQTGLDTGDDEASLKEHVDEAEANFIDITIVENLTKDLQDQIDEDIEKEARSKLKEYHQDDEYEPEIDISSVIENFRFVLIANKASGQKLLK